MYPKQILKLLLSLLLSGFLCVSALAADAEKTAVKPTADTVKVPPVKQKTQKTKMETAKAETAKKAPPKQVKKPRKTNKAKKARTSRYPRPGISMKQVRKQYGEPKSVRKSKGKVKKLWPRITVWNYGSYSVYFERHLVLHTVVH